MKSGDRVLLTCPSGADGRTVDAVVLIASPDDASLMLTFEAILDGHIGAMPVLRDALGTYRSIMTGAPVSITPRLD